MNHMKNWTVVNKGDRNLRVEITRKRMKRIVLQVHHDGSVHIHCPYSTPQYQIESFLEEKKDWLFKAYDKVLLEQRIKSTGTEGIVYIFGKKIKVETRQSINGKSSVRLDHDTMVFALACEEDREILFERFAKSRVENAIELLRNEYDVSICDAFSLIRPKISVRNMSSKWGSCTPKKATIRISSNLIHYPEECLKYVLLHEYVHLLVPNHSREFYGIVEKFMPDYKEAEKMLKGKFKV